MARYCSRNFNYNVCNQAHVQKDSSETYTDSYLPPKQTLYRSYLILQASTFHWIRSIAAIFDRIVLPGVNIASTILVLQCPPSLICVGHFKEVASSCPALQSLDEARRARVILFDLRLRLRASYRKVQQQQPVAVPSPPHPRHMLTNMNSKTRANQGCTVNTRSCGELG